MLPPTQLLALRRPAASKHPNQLFYPPLLVPAPRGLCCPVPYVVERFDGPHNSGQHAVMPLGRIQLQGAVLLLQPHPHSPLSLLVVLLLVLTRDTLLGAFSQC